MCNIANKIQAIPSLSTYVNIICKNVCPFEIEKNKTLMKIMEIDGFCYFWSIKYWINYKCGLKKERRKTANFETLCFFTYKLNKIAQQHELCLLTFHALYEL